MPEVPIPEQLFEIDKTKIIGLTIDPDKTNGNKKA